MLEYLLKTNKETLREDWLRKLPAKNQSEKAWVLLPKGKLNNRVCIVAHIDTVWDDNTKEKVVYFDNNKGVYWSPTGLGADDRAGVAIALKLFANLPENKKPIVLLTDEEENGGRGAYEACIVFKSILKKANFFIGLDRKGKGEAVYYNNEPQEFKDYISSFGFSENNGTFSDLSIISPQIQTCGVNVSVGYQNAHLPTEYLIVTDMLDTYKKVKMILLSKTKKWELPESPLTITTIEEDNQCSTCLQPLLNNIDSYCTCIFCSHWQPIHTKGD